MYKILENAIYSDREQIAGWLGMVVVMEGYVTKGHKETFVREVCVLFPDCMVSCVYTYAPSYQIVYINMCNLFYVDYTSMQL